VSRAFNACAPKAPAATPRAPHTAPMTKKARSAPLSFTPTTASQRRETAFFAFRAFYGLAKRKDKRFPGDVGEYDERNGGMPVVDMPPFRSR
jgi:hypothetical protein